MTPIITDNRCQRVARLGFSTRRRPYLSTPLGGIQLDCRHAKLWVLCSTKSLFRRQGVGVRERRWQCMQLTRAFALWFAHWVIAIEQPALQSRDRSMLHPA